MKPDEFINMQKRSILSQALEILEADMSEVLGSETTLRGHFFIHENAVWIRDYSPDEVLPERLLTKDPQCVVMVRGMRALVHQIGVLSGECWDGWEDYAEGREELL